MDVDFWASRVQPTKQLIAVQASHLTSDNHQVILDEFGGDEDARAFFPCPFCYVEIEIHLLCSHLQNEHCFDLKNAVCRLCAANLGKDATGHFVAQHTSSLKHRRKSQRPDHWIGSNSATLARDVGSFLWPSSNNKGNQNETLPDPLLSPFLCSITIPSPEETQQQDQTSTTDASAVPCSKRCQPGTRLRDEKAKSSVCPAACWVNNFLGESLQLSSCDICRAM